MNDNSKAIPSVTKYVTDMRRSLKYPGAHALYFPPGKENRRRGNFRLARELGWGLQGYNTADINYILGSLYGQLVVANSLDTTGVCVNNKEWLAELRKKL